MTIDQHQGKSFNQLAQELSTAVAPIKAENEEKNRLFGENTALIKRLNTEIYKQSRSFQTKPDRWTHFQSGDIGNTFWVTETNTADYHGGPIRLDTTESSVNVKIDQKNEKISITTTDIDTMKKNNASPDRYEKHQTTTVLSDQLTLKEQQQINQTLTSWNNLLNVPETTNKI